MQNKGAVKLFAIALALVCLYQLSFTWFAARVESQAKEYGRNDLNKENAYLDSVKNKVVYNFIGLQKFTYLDCKERQINLGLDLKGGMNVLLEISVPDILRSLSNYSTDTTFQKALALASEYEKTSTEDYLVLFDRAFTKIDPNAKLAAIFGTELRGKIKFDASNKEVLNVIGKEANDAIDNSFNILRTRIDRTGVIQPNVQKLATKGRILVELPGIRDPDRVTRLLQGAANLEFWETYENSEVYNTLLKANEKIKQIRDAEKAVSDSSAKLAFVKESQEKASKKEIGAKTTKTGESKDTTSLKLLQQIEKGDTLKKDSAGIPDQMKNFPLFSILRPNLTKDNTIMKGSAVGFSNAKDTATVNKYLSIPEVRSLFRDVKFLWGYRPFDENKTLYELHAIRGEKPVLEGSVITNARGEYGQNKAEAEVDMTMNGEGAKTWARVTKKNKDRCIAIVLDNTVVSSPTVHGEIPNGNSQITGRFSIEEAKDLANILESGKMPAPARVVQKDIVGPSLGKESINAGIRSFIIAFIGVLLYMWLYYGKAGNVANVALFANVFFLFGVFASMGLVLTLPGIAGVVLTLAMAVDGNVIIYERMREEVRAGKGERMVVKDGFWHAYSSIIDGHVTTILTGVVLYLFGGTGPVRGFATSLIAGLLLSLFSSIFIARLMFEWMLDRNIKITLGNRFTINAMTKANINFIGLRKLMYIISIAVMVVGAVSLFTRGLDPSVDFKGGRTYQVRFDTPVVPEEIRASLLKSFGSASEVKTFGNTNQVRITTKYMIDNKSSGTDSIVDRKLYEGLKIFYKSPVSYDDFVKQDPTKTLGQMSFTKIDPVISNESVVRAFLAVLYGLIIIFIYIAIRFKNWKYGLGGVISLAHDSMVVVTVFSLFYGVLPFSLEIDQTFIAALLTIIGYSIMDTVIIYDRIREYKKLYPTRPLDENINSAINHTLGRTVNTSGITIVVLVIIFIFGGDILRGFIFALLVGVLTGTYSSVFVATPIAYDVIRLTEKKKQKQQ
jgi:SecD/SecF fusion protein